MAECPLPFRVAEISEHQHPALVQGIEQSQRHLDWRVLGLRQFRPEIFHVRLDGRFVLGKR